MASERVNWGPRIDDLLTALEVGAHVKQLRAGWVTITLQRGGARKLVLELERLVDEVPDDEHP